MALLPRVLVVDDEPKTQRLLRGVLSKGGYKPVLARTAAEALALVSKGTPDVVLVEPHRADDDGGQLLRELRHEWPWKPILVISRCNAEPEKVAALELADDYITKPFGPRELLARIRVALRRTGHIPAPRTRGVLAVGYLRLDLDRHLVFVGQREVHLTRTEHRIFTYLMQNPGRVITHAKLLKQVWGAAYATERPYLRVYMGQLRKKLEDDPTAPRYLRTAPGLGYVLEDCR